MAPARKRKTRFSTNTSLDFLNNVSTIAPTTRRHTARHDSVYDIPTSPEPRKTSRKSEPQVLRRPRTRQNKSTPTPEPAKPPESTREPESVEVAGADQPSSDADDYHDAEVKFFSSDEEEEERNSRADDPRTEGAEILFERWEGNGDEGQEDEDETEMDAEDVANDTSTLPRQDSAEHSGHADQIEEGPNDDSSVHSQGSHQLVPSRRNIEIVIDNSPSARSYLSHGYAETIHDETIHDVNDQEFESQTQPAEQIAAKRKKEIDPNVQLIRDLRHWFVREVKKTSAGPGWNTLNERGRGLKGYAISPRPKYLESLYQLFAEYRNLYKEAIERGGLTELLRKQLENIKESIVTEVRQLFEHASEVLQESIVLDQFEAHFIPKMVILTQLGFRIYRITDGQAHDQLHQTLDLLSVCIGLIKRYMGLLTPRYRSGTLAQPLQRVMKALENGQLRAHWPASANDQHDWADIPPVTHRWTVNEERVLRHGMVRYVDDGQYLPNSSVMAHETILIRV
ncbi:hypothetical protein N7509_010169 [Penicillium cosmopolitanum]|uniref:Uncharacterized protein n=1 Tax=Penicillium cosmopolitanum TaxID=1131564 RepID=A0A9W9VQU7_9EURO|nr:uncharacterized protein N7509_010169 [Penicillium cosmopolitanum]KAJ5387628.1 hypothetical protein N7509_010169 [Penicillium cosmopolitanum]